MKRKIKRDAKAVISVLRRYWRVYTFGNGGSASIADHMACDWMKSTNGRLFVHSLSSNNALLSAIGNDLGYDQTLAAQMRWLKFPECRGVLVVISSSGTSKNIVKAAKQVCDAGADTREIIAFTGEAGDQTKEHVSKYASVNVHCPSKDYGVIEDYHSNVMHEVVRQLKELI